MSARTAEYLEAIEHLPAGGMLVFHQVSWEEYESLVEDLQESWPGVRVTYDEGRLEIMSPTPEHERYKEFVFRLAVALAEELDIPLESFGATTWKRRELRRGTEPDTCFYLTNIEKIIQTRRITLETDPPPDIVVEIDITTESRSKFAIYAIFGIPEIWIYDGEHVQFFQRTDGGSYAEISASRFLPHLTRTALEEALEASKTQGHTAALKAFRQKIRAAKKN